MLIQNNSGVRQGFKNQRRIESSVEPSVLVPPVASLGDTPAQVQGATRFGDVQELANRRHYQFSL
ncbi:hypothetical protein WI61_23060 [Burkholderia cepacia]|nr:hypothetical protein WI61_23060 [Burkholderia cepacia]KVC03662.1 hypothetical protein WI68_15020 [Burkholderia cepacia]